MIVGVGYLMIGLCMAEMVSILTFDGGYYGYARVTLGPLGGYLVGCSGLIESIFYFGAYPLKIGQFAHVVFDFDDKYYPLVWFIIYVILVLIHACVGKYFWKSISFFAICCILLFIIYLFGSMPQLNLEKYAYRTPAFNKDPEVFFDSFQLCVVFFLGFDMLTLTSSEVKDVSEKRKQLVFLLAKFLMVNCIFFFFFFSSLGEKSHSLFDHVINLFNACLIGVVDFHSGRPVSRSGFQTLWHQALFSFCSWLYEHVWDFL
jgi:amino acid transporter